MRKIEWTSQFKRDFRRESKGQYHAILDDNLFPIVERLAKDKALEARHRDHSLSGSWKDHRDCHIKPDLVLIYQKTDPHIIRLVRLGPHSELGL
jgi:mRNA interferase YafQ